MLTKLYLYWGNLKTEPIPLTFKVYLKGMKMSYDLDKHNCLKGVRNES